MNRFLISFFLVLAALSLEGCSTAHNPAARHIIYLSVTPTTTPSPAAIPSVQLSGFLDTFLADKKWQEGYPKSYLRILKEVGMRPVVISADDGSTIYVTGFFDDGYETKKWSARWAIVANSHHEFTPSGSELIESFKDRLQAAFPGAAINTTEDWSDLNGSPAQ